MATDLTKMVMIVLGITIVLNLAGIPTGAGLILEAIGVDVLSDSVGDVKLSPLYIAVLAVFAAAAVTGIIVGFFTRSSPESFLLIALATLFASFVTDIFVVYQYAVATYPGYISKIVGSIMSVIGVGYLMAVVSWWGGRS